MKKYIITNHAAADHVALILRRDGFCATIEQDGDKLVLFTDASRSAQVLSLGIYARSVYPFPI